jgi:protein gp37
MVQATKIEWVRNPDGTQGHTVNPWIGCKHNCYYCYAKKLNNRFHFVKNWEEPEYQSLWLHKIDNLKKPSTIFMGSMCDLFGDWMLSGDIQNILNHCGTFTQHKFLFLTKNSKRYREFNFPKNCWKGATITTGVGAIFLCVRGAPKLDFVSVEPLLTEIGDYFPKTKWIIVGGLTGSKAPHSKYWVDHIITIARNRNIPIFLKSNLKYPKVIQEFPETLIHKIQKDI